MAAVVRGGGAGERLWQRVAPRQLEETTPLQRVEREVELVEACPQPQV